MGNTVLCHEVSLSLSRTYESVKCDVPVIRNLQEKSAQKECVGVGVGGISVNKYIWEHSILQPLLGFHNACEIFKGSEKSGSKDTFD